MAYVSTLLQAVVNIVLALLDYLLAMINVNLVHTKPL